MIPIKDSLTKAFRKAFPGCPVSEPGLRKEWELQGEQQH